MYNSASGTFQVTGPLTLDAQGDPDAVFIFQTASTLTDGRRELRDLVNGAQACNVFWKVGSAATLNATTDFVGTVMAHDDISVEGRRDGQRTAARRSAGEPRRRGDADPRHDHDADVRSAASRRSDLPHARQSPPPTTQGSHGTSTAPGTGQHQRDGSRSYLDIRHGYADRAGWTRDGRRRHRPTAPQVTNTPSGPVGTGDSQRSR